MVFIDLNGAAEILNGINEILADRVTESAQFDRGELLYVIKPAIEYAIGSNSNSEKTGAMNDVIDIINVSGKVESFHNEMEPETIDTIDDIEVVDDVDVVDSATEE